MTAIKLTVYHLSIFFKVLHNLFLCHNFYSSWERNLNVPSEAWKRAAVIATSATRASSSSFLSLKNLSALFYRAQLVLKMRQRAALSLIRTRNQHNQL